MKADELKALALLPFNSLLLVTGLQLIAHQSHLPSWLIGFVVLVGLLRFFSLKTHAKTIHSLVKFCLIVISTAVFVLYYRTNFSVDMAAAFLFLSVSLKLIEVKKNKDIYLFIFTSMYLSAVGFLFDQSIVHTLLQVVIIKVCFYVLFYIQFEPQSATGMHGKLIRFHTGSMSKLLLIAIPIVLVFFIFFPRISPLWQIPLKNEKTKVGMSSELSPGDITELAQSAEPAFRVTFNDAPPSKESMYWKGLVLDYFDGRKWTQSALVNIKNASKKLDTGRLFDYQGSNYQVILEPHQEKWVFALNGSIAASSNIKMTEMGLFSLLSEAFQPTRYQMSGEFSALNYVEGIPQAIALDNGHRIFTSLEQDLQLPRNEHNPQTRDYIKRLRSRIPDKKALLLFLLNRFAEEDFYYTLKPSSFGDNFIDEFLFDKKSGFCGHYSSSLAYMLRLANIPARVAVGYQGGEYNDSGNYFLVSQYDAHAWVEAYLPDIGWFRVDPTAMVAPSRILDGSRSSLGQEDAFLENNFLASAALKFEFLNWIRLSMDELNFQWQKLVVNYHQDQQTKLMTNILGEFNLLRIALVFVYFFISLFVFLMLYLLFKRFAGFTWAQKKYLLWLFVLGRLGFTRESGETPRRFLERVKKSQNKWLVNISEKQTLTLEREEYAQRD